MILLDTPIWVWWIDQNDRLSERARALIALHQAEGLGLSVISCWEVAKLVEYDRLRLACSLEEWMSGALAMPNLQLLGVTPQITVVSTQLPQPFHRDPADQLIVATARIYDLPMLTVDEKLLKYPHIKTL